MKKSLEDDIKYLEWQEDIIIKEIRKYSPSYSIDAYKSVEELKKYPKNKLIEIKNLHHKAMELYKECLRLKLGIKLK